MDQNMSKATLKCQKYELLYQFLEKYGYINARNGQD